MTSARGGWRASTVTNDGGGVQDANFKVPATRNVSIASHKERACAAEVARSPTVLLHAAMRELARPMLAQLSAPESAQNASSPSARLRHALSPSMPSSSCYYYGGSGTLLPTAGAAAAVTSAQAASVGASTGTAAPLLRSSSERLPKFDRNGSILARALSNELLPELSPSQVQTLRRSWKHIYTKGLFDVVKTCFQKLESSHSVVLSAFVFTENPPSILASVSPKSSTTTRTSRHQLTRQPKLSSAGGNAAMLSSATESVRFVASSASHNQLAPSSSVGYANVSITSSSSYEPDASAPASMNTSPLPEDLPLDSQMMNLQQQHGFSRSPSSLEADASEGVAPDRVRQSPSPTPQRSFAPTVRNATRYFLDLIQRIVDNEMQLDLELKRIGARHVALYDNCSIGVREIEHLGEIFAEAFCKLDGIRQSKETTRTWRMLIAKIIDHIRDGFETEMRFQRRKNSQFRGKLSIAGVQSSAASSRCSSAMRCSAAAHENAGDEAGSSIENRRNSIPSARQSSQLAVEQVARKFSNI